MSHSERINRFIRFRSHWFAIVGTSIILVLAVKGIAYGVSAFQTWQHDKAIADHEKAVKDAADCKANGGYNVFAGLPIPCKTDPNAPDPADPLAPLSGTLTWVIGIGLGFSMVAAVMRIARE